MLSIVFLFLGYLKKLQILWRIWAAIIFYFFGFDFILNTSYINEQKAH